jgi:hypothetical protein
MKNTFFTIWSIQRHNIYYTTSFLAIQNLLIKYNKIMETFNTVILSIAAFFLIVGLTIFGVVMKRASAAATYPPSPSMCPDYWKVSWNTDGTYTCTSSSGTTLTSTAMGTGSTALCNKYKYAKANSLSWDGITNVTAPC